MLTVGIINGIKQKYLSIDKMLTTTYYES